MMMQRPVVVLIPSMIAIVVLTTLLFGTIFPSSSSSNSIMVAYAQQPLTPAATTTSATEQEEEELKTIVICHITWLHRVSTAAAAHAHHTVNLRDPSKKVKFEYILVNYNGNNDQRDTILSYINAPTNCSVILGPSTSFQSLAISPIVDKPWISDTASSTELSNKDTHPWFSRATPTNIDIGGAVGEAAAQMFGWKKAAILCGDDSYGRSLAEGFSSALRRNGGQILSSECIAPTTPEEIDGALDRLTLLEETGQTRVVFVSAYPENMIIDEILRRGLDKKIIWILHEVACLQGSVTVGKMPGAICPEYGLVQDRFDAYKEQWLQHPDGLYTQMFSDPNMYVQLPEYTIFTTSALTSDAAEFFMQAYENGYYVNCSSNATCFNQLTNEDMLDILRKTKTDGITGPFQLLPNGDRIGAVMTLNNVQPNGTVKIIGTYNSVEGISDLRGGEQLYFLNTGFMDTPIDAPAQTTEDEIPTLLVVGLFVGAVILIMFFVAVYKLRNATKEVYMKIIRSGANWVLLASILAAFADFMTDVLACYHVWISEYDLVFQVFYSLLTILSLIVSFIDIQLMVRFFVKSLEAGSLNDTQIADWKLTIQKAHCVSLVAEDLPMVVLAVVANQQRPNTFLIISVIFSCTAIGWKADEVPAVLRSFRDSGVSDKDIPIGGAGGGALGKTMGMMSVATVEPFDRFTEPDILEQFADYVAENFPARSNNLVAKAEQMSIDLAARKVTRAEFFSIVNPVLMSRFEDDGEDNSKVARNAGGIPEGSIMTREDMAASKLMRFGPPGSGGGGANVVKASTVVKASSAPNTSSSGSINNSKKRQPGTSVDWSPMMGMSAGAEEEDEAAFSIPPRGGDSTSNNRLRPVTTNQVAADTTNDSTEMRSTGFKSRNSVSTKSNSNNNQQQKEQGRRSFQIVINDHKSDESKDGPALATGAAAVSNNGDNTTSATPPSEVVEKNPLSPQSAGATADEEDEVGEHTPASRQLLSQTSSRTSLGISFGTSDGVDEDNLALIAPAVVASAAPPRRRSEPQQQQQTHPTGNGGNSSSTSSRSGDGPLPHPQQEDVFDMVVESVRLHPDSDETGKE